MGKTSACVIVLALALAGCRGKLVATAELKGPGTATTHFASTPKPVTVWADTDAKWTGGEHSKPEISYEVDVRQNGKDVGNVSCSTTNSGGKTVCGTDSNIMGTHDADCEYLLACTLPALQPGDVEVKVTGATGANVKSTKKMSLNFRAE